MGKLLNNDDEVKELLFRAHEVLNERDMSFVDDFADLLVAELDLPGHQLEMVTPLVEGAISYVPAHASKAKHELGDLLNHIVQLAHEAAQSEDLNR